MCGESDGAERETPDAVQDGGKSLLTRIFDSMSHPRRRYLLYHLRDEDCDDIDDLARRIAGWEDDVPVDAVSDESADRVKIDLVHNHLPKLEDDKIVEYDERSGTVCFTHRPEILDDVVDLAVKIERPS